VLYTEGFYYTYTDWKAKVVGTNPFKNSEVFQQEKKRNVE